MARAGSIVATAIACVAVVAIAIAERQARPAPELRLALTGTAALAAPLLLAASFGRLTAMPAMGRAALVAGVLVAPAAAFALLAHGWAEAWLPGAPLFVAGVSSALVLGVAVLGSAIGRRGDS